MTKDYAIPMSEVLEYLKGIREEDREKVSSSLLHFIKSKSDPNYVSTIDYSRPLNELEISDEAKYMISYICYKYWCDTPEKKHHYSKMLKHNDDVINEINWEKYNPEKIFAERNLEQISEQEKNGNTEIIEKKTSKISLFFDKILSIFKFKKKGK